jgi:hypothetical protein
MKDETKVQSRSKRNEAKEFFLGGGGDFWFFLMVSK